MIVGFTGTRLGMTRNQRGLVYEFLTEAKSNAGSSQDEFHHGDCKGADEQAFELAAELGYKTFAHPCTFNSWRAFTESDIILPPLDSIKRNKEIVIVSTIMIAAPITNYEVLRSGTWATIRYAKQKNKISTFGIFYP
jgi:hypothetical protein